MHRQNYVSDIDETQTYPPSPMLLMVTTDGLLLCYYMMLSLPHTPSLNVHAEPLQGTERPSTYHFDSFLPVFTVVRQILWLPSTLWTAASLRPVLPVVSGSALQVAISSSCHDTVAPSSVVGRFLLHARQTAWNSLSPRSVA